MQARVTVTIALVCALVLGTQAQTPTQSRSAMRMTLVNAEAAVYKAEAGLLKARVACEQALTAVAAAEPYLEQGMRPIFGGGGKVIGWLFDGTTASALSKPGDPCSLSDCSMDDHAPDVAAADSFDVEAVLSSTGAYEAFIQDHNVYSLTGHHLGTLDSGIFRDHEGNTVAFLEGASGASPLLPTISNPGTPPTPSLAPLQPVFDLAPLEPLPTLNWSSMTWSNFIAQ